MQGCTSLPTKDKDVSHLTILFEAKAFLEEIDQAEEGGYGPPKAKFMRLDYSGQLWGADFKNRCYTGKIWELQPRFQV